MPATQVKKVSCLQAGCMYKATEPDRILVGRGYGVAGLGASGDVGAQQSDAGVAAVVSQQAHVVGVCAAARAPEENERSRPAGQHVGCRQQSQAGRPACCTVHMLEL